MDDKLNTTKKSRKNIPIIFMILGLAEVVVSAIILTVKFWGITDLGFQLTAHVIVGLLWIIQGIILAHKSLGNSVYIVIATILLLGTAYGLLTLHTMTDYIVKSGGYNSELTLEEFKEHATMTVTSKSLKDGRWDTAIAGEGIGNNEIPQLTFDKVSGAQFYVIYMLDESAGNWLHWKAFEINKTNIEKGEELPLENSSYAGPHPPIGSGNHKYVIYVYALKKRPDSGYLGEFYESGMDAAQYHEINLNIADGESGNVISYGYLEGYFSAD
ncbi:MAG: hypothetical protein K6F55_11050 [Eubacterium sp.]|nr:hypothetical protein [Eubacterium sp.]